MSDSSLSDPLAGIARFYDQLMDHVSYGRWARITRILGGMISGCPLHVDVACGTGTLVQAMRAHGWASFGADLSPGMLRAARRKEALPLAVADMRALPFHGRAGVLTCLFDSLNFLLDEASVRQAFESFHAALASPGLAYFDIVTERMVSQHFAGQVWNEDNGQFKSHWRSTFERGTGIADSLIRINTGPEVLVRERIFPAEFIRAAAEMAGFTVIGVFDADAWRAPGRRTTRIDFVAVKGDPTPFQRALKQICKEVQRMP